MSNPESWPVPDDLKGASAYDAFLWYICQSWPVFFGREYGQVRTLYHHEFGATVLQYGPWRLALRDIDAFPEPYPESELDV